MQTQDPSELPGVTEHQTKPYNACHQSLKSVPGFSPKSVPKRAGGLI
jgi:hypothetical protein